MPETKMPRVQVQMTEELLDAIDLARGDKKRNPAIESWLWRIRDIQKAANKLKLKRRKRKPPGRPSLAEKKTGTDRKKIT